MKLSLRQKAAVLAGLHLLQRVSADGLLTPEDARNAIGIFTALGKTRGLTMPEIDRFIKDIAALHPPVFEPGVAAEYPTRQEIEEHVREELANDPHAFD